MSKKQNSRRKKSLRTLELGNGKVNRNEVLTGIGSRNSGTIVVHGNIYIGSKEDAKDKVKKKIDWSRFWKIVDKAAGVILTVIGVLIKTFSHYG